MSNLTISKHERWAYLTKRVMQLLKDRGGSAPIREIFDHMAKTETFDDWEKASLDNSPGVIRWENALRWDSVDYVAVGYLQKQRGIWILTPEGEQALSLPAVDIRVKAKTYYQQWRKQQRQLPSLGMTDTDVGVSNGQLPDVEDSLQDSSEAEIPIFQVSLDKAKDDARQGIRDYILNLGPYPFQDLVAALLRGMGYSTPFIAKRGRDGGTDILAYPDPLGTQTPHVRVQVKHRRDTKATNDEVMALRGCLLPSKDVGLFVSSSGFTSEAKKEAQRTVPHIECLDLEQLIDHWLTVYTNLSEEDKVHLRLTPVSFFDPS